MDKYRKVPREKETSVKDDEEIRVTAQGRVSAYITYAAKVFDELKKPKVVVKATGNALTKAVTAAEVIKRRFAGLHQITNLGTTEIVDEYEPLEEGLDRVVDTRSVSFIEITLSKEALDTKDKGYQPPIDESLVKEFDPEQMQRSRGRGRGKGRGKGKGKGDDSPKGKGKKGKGEKGEKGKGKGKDDKGKGKGKEKGKGKDSYDDYGGKSKGKGKGKDDKGKGKGKGKEKGWDDWGYSAPKGKGKGGKSKWDDWSYGGYGGYSSYDSYDSYGYGGSKGKDKGKGKGKGKGKSAW